MNESMNQFLEEDQEQEIDIIELLKRLWVKRKIILIITGCFAAVGLFVALFTPEEYTSSCTFVPQMARRTNSSISSVAAMAGINMDNMSNSSSSLSPYVYPQILENVDYLRDIMYFKITFNGVTESVTLFDYYTKPEYRKFNLLGTVRKYTLGLPGVVIGALKSKPAETVADTAVSVDGIRLKSFTNEEFGVASIIMSKLKMELNDKDGYITISANMPEPVAAAELVQISFDLLQKYITEFKQQKAQSQMDFIESRYEETKADFENKQLELARFKDANRVISSATAKTRLDKLVSDYNIANAIYLEMAKQRILAGIKVKEDTPVLTAVKPAMIPHAKSKPQPMRILAVWIFMGAILGCGAVFGLDFLKDHGAGWPKSWVSSKKGVEKKPQDVPA
ncbi:MAG: Wzz/FepE/Etk N-terminal domain-containing protein [Bacteroidales bacterium]|nr:Wzz/FepE/Etk N-terminal domain-containing protein [Bacteroidales bacterium]MDD4670895.1 Wzz/FepE/Etk N-terminal domain-containing protein [Bacteroidales bacterium]